MYVDALSMQMVKNPAQFDVIVTCNMFGDIITDIGAQLQGGLGLAASGNINPDGVSMFEPVHGSAPKYAGRNSANPLGAILTAQLLVEHIGLDAMGSAIERAAIGCLEAGECTTDLEGRLSTSEAGDAVCARLRSGG
jgi:3-isopropylmalate dehydrogenase